MSKLLLVLLSIIFLNFSSYTQNAEADTLTSIQNEIFKSDSLSADSLKMLNDSIEYELIRDTLKRIFNIADTLLLKDSIPGKTTYEYVMDNFRDSLFFDEPDSIHYVIYSLNNLLNNDIILLNDTIKQAINKLIDYSGSREIKPVINYLQFKLNKSGLLTESGDSSLKSLNDSIYYAVEYLIKNILEDSIKFSFTNINNDSILFYTRENEVDSIRLNLFDNRGEYAVLWIKKSDTNIFDIYLEDGIYLEKTKQRKVVDQRLDTEFVIPELKKMKKVDMILPIWKFGGIADIRYNQGYISESWAEGGASSMSALSILKYSADYSYGKKIILDTDIECRLGYLKSGDDDIQKNDDKLEINVKYGMSAFNDWYYSALLNFKTQFLKGYNYSNDTTIGVSEFLSPAYLIFSLGLDYKPSNKLTILFSPITSKFTIVADTVNFDQTRFGVGKDEIIRQEIGAYVKTVSKIRFRNNIMLLNKVNFFTNYLNNPQNIDVDWEVDLAVKLTDYIKMSVNAHFIYDDDVEIPVIEDGVEIGKTKKGQFKELFGIGFSYSF